MTVTGIRSLCEVSCTRSAMTELPTAAVSVKGRVRHRLGEVLAETVNHKGGRPTKNGNIVLPFLPDGINKMESSRTQQLAMIPWEEIEQRIATATEENRKAGNPPSFARAAFSLAHWPVGPVSWPIGTPYS